MLVSVVDWYGRHFGLGWNDLYELFVLEEFLVFAVSFSDFIFSGVDGLCCVSAGFYC